MDPNRAQGQQRMLGLDARGRLVKIAHLFDWRLSLKSTAPAPADPTVRFRHTSPVASRDGAISFASSDRRPAVAQDEDARDPRASLSKT